MLKPKEKFLIELRKRARHRLVPNLQNDGKTLRHMLLEVCGACQNNCQNCAHVGLRRDNPRYQLSMEQLERLLLYTEQSGYFIEKIRLHGSGEPLLWKNLNEGIGLLSRSPVIGTILLATNGLSLERILERTWDDIDKLRISVYANFNNDDLLEEITRKYPQKVVIKRVKSFSTLPNEGENFPIPCSCRCSGPMAYGDHLFFYCGPPVFQAARLRRTNVWEYKDIYTEIKMGYLKNYCRTQGGNMDLCRSCWANSYADPPWEVNTAEGGDLNCKENADLNR